MDQAAPTSELRVLLLEDTPTDAELIVHELRKAGIAFTSQRVDTRAAFVTALREFRPDIVLSDYKLPDFDGMSALQLVQRDYPGVPVIMVTGALPDIDAVDLIRAGARDYVLKDRLARLGPAVQRALVEEASRRAREEAENALRENEALLQAVIKMLPIGLWVIDAKGKIVLSNDAAQQIWSGVRYVGVEQLGEYKGWRLDTGKLIGAHDWAGARALEKGETTIEEEAEIECFDGTRKIILDSAVPLRGADGSIRCVVTVNQDITERKRAEQALRESYHQIELARDEWNNAFDAMRDPMFFHDQQCRITRCNRAYAERAGLPFKQIIGRPYWEVFPKGDGPLKTCHGEMEKATEKSIEEVRLESGEIFISRSFSARDPDGAYLFSVHVMEEITERKHAEASLLRLNRALKALGGGNHALVHSNDELELMQGICDAVTEGGAYRLAWVGKVMQDERKGVEPVAMAGAGLEYVKALQITWADEPLGRGPSGVAVRAGQIQIAQDIAHDPHMAPWRDAAAKFGLASTISLPLRANGVVVGVLTLYAAETDAFDADAVALLEEMSEDLSFGMTALRTRIERDHALEERQQYAEQLRAGLEDALLAISATVEMRDPYTAGHQRRVADLAFAIAKEMGLPDEQAHGIRLAGVVHDLGKIHIPAEVLSKPGRLSELEFTFIKIHPQAGYDILKGIEFPWPIAQVVLQHHERLDGSGYPQGLKGDAIMLEARILAVADVLEAMASHRPYRPSLGLAAALTEIREKRGTQFDPAVVDACINLFEKRNYALPI